MKRTFAYILLTVIASMDTLAIDYFVSQSGTHTAPYTNWVQSATNIAEALSYCSAGDNVFVSNGNYFVTDPIMITNSVMLASINGRDNTFINGSGASLCVFMSNTGAHLNAFTLMNGSNQYGGGLCITNGGTVSDSRLCGNYARNGAGVYISQTGYVQNTIICCNTSRLDGGGVYINRGGFINDCHIYNNTTLNGGIGGGAGCMVFLGGEIRRSIIESNSTPGTAGGVLSYYHILMDQCIIRGNSPNGVMHGYGGAYVYNTLIENNTMHGVYFEGNIQYYNCTFTKNAGYAMDADLYLHGSSKPGVIMNCIFYPEPTHIVAYSVTQPAYSNNFAADPLFTDWTNGDYRLSHTSPCINAGASDTWYGDMHDLDGVPRLVDNAPDIGAYEYYSSDGTAYLTNNNLVASWNVLTGQIYVVEYASDLNGIWSSIDSPSVATTSILSAYSDNSGSNKYFRLKYVY